MIERHTSSGGVEHRAEWRPAADPLRAGDAPVRRASGTIWCRARRRWAVVSVIERQGESGSLRYVQWCSLTGIEVECAQACLGAFEGALRSDQND
jgi:hypothetical protein